MQRALVILLCAGAALSLLLFLTDTGETPEVDPSELARLVARAHVVWDDFGEGVKAAVGATPAAQWHGEPSDIRLGEGVVEVTFELRGPWTEYDFGIPVLLRTPEGRVLAPEKYTRGTGGGTYTFRLAESATPISMPWVELKFPPYEEHRYVLDTTGTWKK